MSAPAELESLESVLEKSNIPAHELSEVRRILYGSPSTAFQIPQKAQEIAEKHNFDLKGYIMPKAKVNLLLFGLFFCWREYCLYHHVNETD
jgi:hypothetical protein